MEQKLKRLYEFGPFQLDPAERLLLRAGEAVPLPPKALDVLQVMVEQAGRLLEKEVLLKTVWPDSVVEENNLADNIFKLRRALGEGEQGQKFIETVPRRGYRFVANVKELQGEERAPAALAELAVATLPRAPVATEPVAELDQQARRPAQLLLSVFALLALMLAGVGLYPYFKPAPRAESLAVLPFSAAPETEYLADGITESLINNLSRLSNLRVTARATAFSYKHKDASPIQVGRELQVGTVLTGRVALRDDALTVQVEMVDAETGAQRWGERYQRKLSDIFAVEEEIGRQIADKLRLRLSGEEQRQLAKRYTENAEVYQLHLQGVYTLSRLTEPALRKAIDYFHQAIAKDPHYAPAYAGLVNAYLLLGAEEGPEKLLPLAKAAAARALELDPELAEAHRALSFIKWPYELDWAGAESELQQALKLKPNSVDAHIPYARLLADAGRFDEARAQALRALELDPRAIPAMKLLGYIHFLARRYDEAEAEYRKLIEIAPGFLQAQRELGLVYEQKGMYAEALSQFQIPLAAPENYFKTMIRADIGHLYAVWGKRTEAEQVLTELRRKSQQSYVSAYDIAVIYAGLGEREQAFAWLDKAIAQRPYWLCWLKLDPRLDGLRADPRWRGLLLRAGQTP